MAPNRGKLVSHDGSDGPITLFVPGLEGGGAQRVIVNLANTLADISGDAVNLVVIRKGGVFEDEIRSEVNLINLETGRVSRSIPALVNYLITYRPKVFMSTLNYCNVIAIIAWRLAGRPCRLVVREANVVRKENFLLRSLMRWTYPQVDCVVALSPEVRASILDAGIRVADRIIEIGNPGLFRPPGWVGPPPSFLPQTRPRFICAVGRLSWPKGFDILLEAFSGLSDTCLHLVILGEGELRLDLEEQIRLSGLQQRVHLPGFVKDPAAVISHAELFVLSSRWEGFPNVLLEALSVGVPIVAADCDGAPRSMLENGRHGHLFAPEDPVALSEGIEKALKTPAGTPESRRARAVDFSAEAITKRYLKEAFDISP